MVRTSWGTQPGTTVLQIAGTLRNMATLQSAMQNSKIEIGMSGPIFFHIEQQLKNAHHMTSMLASNLYSLWCKKCS